FSMQSKSTEISGGLIANYNLAEAGEKQLIAGLYYRHKDAVIPMIGFEVNTLRFTFSYDATMSTLKNFNNYRGATEFTLVKKGFYAQSGDRQSMCPQF
ncbi:MAG TPA: type IX secretion system membrane protein PorP/SprF, partial [Ferruginibacter sp.]|nr:type IX secretion system membrane protein PorP/SprF [Ferruginibacter sp.]